MKGTAHDGVKVYHVTAGKTTPQWLSGKSHESLRRNEDYRRRIEIIQDLEFPAACHRLKLSPDGQFLVATGTHPPRVKVFELSQLALKFERHLDAEIVDCQILSEDYAKMVFLCNNRSLEFHAKFGAYHKLRMPFHGRAMTYCPYTAELLCVGSSSSICRLSLSEGHFQAPLTARAEAVNACALSSACSLLACAGEGGLLEGFDPRTAQPVGCLDAAAAMGVAGQDLTAVAFEEAGLQCAVGTSQGLVGVFDLRASKPLAVKDHMYSDAIRSIQYHHLPGDSGRGERRIASADSHSVRLWDPLTQQAFTTIEPASPINDVLLWPGSGLLMCACDAPRIEAYFVPALGPAPKWSSFLENLTEELEESAAPTLYEDYRFVTRQQIGSLGLGHLVGTPLLRAYMHGYFMHQRLWQRAQSLAPSDTAAAQRAATVAAQLDAQRASRITLRKRLPKVNPKMAERAMAEDAKRQKVSADGKAAPSLLADQRFGRLFEDPDYAIDEEAAEYRIMHPNAGQGRRSKALAQDSDEAPSASDDADQGSEGESDSDEDARPAYAAKQRVPAERPRPESSGRGEELPRGRRKAGQQGRGVRMFAAQQDPDAAAPGSSEAPARSSLRDVPLGSRAPAATAAGKAGFKPRLDGAQEISFVPRGRGRGRGGSSSRGRGSSEDGAGRDRSGRGRGGGRSGGSRGRSRGRGRGRR